MYTKLLNRKANPQNKVLHNLNIHPLDTNSNTVRKLSNTLFYQCQNTLAFALVCFGNDSVIDNLCARVGVFSSLINPFKPDFTIVIFIHYKSRIAVAILD